MQFTELDEIIEENTLPTISKKTRISVQNLEALLARDWERLKKVQALGFISILEREYHLDLSGLRAECRAYYETHAPEQGERGPVITPAPEPRRHGPSKALIALVILLAAAGGYLLFSSQTGQEREDNATALASVRSEGFFDSVLSTAKGWFGNGEEPESPLASDQEKPPAVQGAWARKPRAAGVNATATSKPKETSQERAASASTPEDNASKELATAERTAAPEEQEEERIITQVKKEQTKAEEIRKQAAEEENLSPTGEGGGVSEISKMILAATAGTESPADTPADQAAPLEPQVPGLQAKAPNAKGEQKAQTPPQKPQPGLKEATGRAERPAEEAPAQNEGVSSGLVIMHPRSKIWVGYTNLRTMKRATKVTADDLAFDTAAGDYILAVGHGQIDFKTRTGEKRLSDGKRHFFMIAKGEVREISHEEFQKLNKSKVW